LFHHRGKKGAHKIEAFNDIKRDQKPREYQERRRRGLRVRSEFGEFLRALGAGETFSSRRLGISISTRYYFSLREASFFFAPAAAVASRRKSSIFFCTFFLPHARGPKDEYNIFSQNYAPHHQRACDILFTALLKPVWKEV
jgi:hypothetical protein